MLSAQPAPSSDTSHITEVADAVSVFLDAPLERLYAVQALDRLHKLVWPADVGPAGMCFPDLTVVSEGRTIGYFEGVTFGPREVCWIQHIGLAHEIAAAGIGGEADDEHGLVVGLALLHVVCLEIASRYGVSDFIFEERSQRPENTAFFRAAGARRVPSMSDQEPAKWKASIVDLVLARHRGVR